MNYKGLMNFLLIFVCPLLSAADIGPQLPIPTDEIVVKSSQYGPYEKYQSDVSESFSITSYYKNGNTVYERITYLDLTTGASRNVRTTSHTLRYRRASTVNITIPTSALLGDEGLVISIEIYNSPDSSYITGEAIVIYPIGTETINPLNYLENGYETKYIAAAFPSDSYKEKLTFESFADYFLTDIYYRIPLDQFDIEIETFSDSYTLGQGTMTIVGMRDYLPYLNGQGNDAIISLRLSKNGNKIQVNYGSSMYVNPKTLTMSSTPKSGYVITNNFYLPVNQWTILWVLKLDFILMVLATTKLTYHGQAIYMHHHHLSVIVIIANTVS